MHSWITYGMMDKGLNPHSTVLYYQCFWSMGAMALVCGQGQGSMMYVCCCFFAIYSSTYLHYTILHYHTLHYHTLHYTTIHYTTLHYTLTTIHYTTLHYHTLHYTTLHYHTLHYHTLHYTTIHYTTIHYTTLYSKVLDGVHTSPLLTHFQLHIIH